MLIGKPSEGFLLFKGRFTIVKILKAIFFIILLSSMAMSQAFVDKGYHPKLTALGRSVTALTSDASLMFYNPAAIGFATSGNIFTGYTDLYPDISDVNMNVINAGAAYSLGQVGVIGLAVSQFSPGAWNEQIFVGSFATRIFNEDLSLGANVKILRWSAGAPQGENAVPEPALSYSGFTFDAGVTYVLREIMEENDLQLGASLLNATQPSVAKNGSKDAVLPMEFNVGAAYLSHKYNYAIASGISFRDGELRFTFGAEINALKTSIAGVESEFVVRVGGGRVAVKDSQGEYNGGFGLRVDRVMIDYSYSYQVFIRNVGGISSISLGYEF